MFKVSSTLFSYTDVTVIVLLFIRYFEKDEVLWRKAGSKSLKPIWPNVGGDERLSGINK
jgi:hypothetical protein